MFLEQIHNRRNQKWIDVEKMHASKLPFVMYGAGINAVLCAKFLKEHSIAIDAVCVTGKSNIGGTGYFDGMPVMTLGDVAGKYDKFNCLIAFADTGTARKNLAGYNGVEEIFVLDNPGVVEDIDYRYVENNLEAFQKTYDLLDDTLSREAFVDFLNVRIGGEPILDGRVIQQQYFCDIVPLKDDEVLIDCGAYDGDTILSFIEKTSRHYDGIYAFEPDANNYARLQHNIEANQIERVKLYLKGVWDRKAVLRFSSPVASASCISTDGEIEVEVDSIDNIVGKDRATMIKMDIEGAELPALKGARSLIERERPKLAICVYHKAEDLIAIPPYLAGIIPESKFYLRRHSQFSLETVFYAIPDHE